MHGFLSKMKENTQNCVWWWFGHIYSGGSLDDACDLPIFTGLSQWRVGKNANESWFRTVSTNVLCISVSTINTPTHNIHIFFKKRHPSF
jgi:hypothetical protein